MELIERINSLEGEVKLIKTEIKKVLIDLRETMNNLENPFANIEQMRKKNLDNIDFVSEHEPETMDGSVKEKGKEKGAGAGTETEVNKPPDNDHGHEPTPETVAGSYSYPDINRSSIEPQPQPPVNPAPIDEKPHQPQEPPFSGLQPQPHPQPEPQPEPAREQMPQPQVKVQESEGEEKNPETVSAVPLVMKQGEDRELENIKKIAVIATNREEAGEVEVDILTLAQLMSWTANSIAHIGKTKLNKIIDLYDRTGRLPKEVKEMIYKIESLSDLPDAGEEKEMVEMKDCILVLYQLDRIVSGETQMQAPLMLSEEELEKWLKV